MPKAESSEPNSGQAGRNLTSAAKKFEDIFLYKKFKDIFLNKIFFTEVKEVLNLL